jgi:anaerobic magnesium-protoporphyrin IX monomethyl ester cyclase
MKVMLCAPPNWTPTMPHLALPTLTAYLRAYGVSVIQRDLNLEVFDTLLTQQSMRESIARLREQSSGRAERHPSPGTPPADRVRWALQQGPLLANQVEQAKRVIRSDAFFDGPVGLRAFQTVAACLEIASLPYYPATLHLQSYQSAMPVDSSRSLLQGVRDTRHNLFIDLYRRTILPEIAREAPDIVGISIPSMPQMLAAMTLAYLVKESGLKCHVTVGGPHVSMLREQIAKTPTIFQLIDSAVIFDGEVPLLRLAEALDGRGELDDVPNLIYRKDDQIRVTARKVPEKISNLPLPDFDGLPLDRYLAPHLVLPLMTARGCYFGKCAFCNVGYGEAETFSQLRAEHLADQMQALHERYGARHIFFSDEAVTPRNLKALSAILPERNLELHWGGCARFEKVLTRELLEQMHTGGCRMILFGLESASQPIIDLMVKGTKLDHMSRILRESAGAGIWNHTFLFFGFPGESIADAQQTVNFLYAHKEYVHSAAVGTFLMERDSPAHRFPQSYNVKRIIEEPDKDLAIYFDYEVESGMDDHMAELVEGHFLNTLPDKPYPQFYVSDVFRFLYASHLNEQKLPFSPWLAAETTAA